MTVQLDIDDVVAGHPLAEAELERLRAIKDEAKAVVRWLEKTEASRARYGTLMELVS
jgi:hypothetical protein